MFNLQAEIESIYSNAAATVDERVGRILADFRQGLNQGAIRAAEPNGQSWNANVWVKKGLALCARLGRLSQAAPDSPIELDTLPQRTFTLEDRVRVADSTCFVRDGACISPGCTLMPHTVVQMGVYVGPNTVIDAGSSIGACAQIGAGVHINAGVQIHGQVQPLESLPVIVGDGASIGANSVIGTGAMIGAGAVVFPGMVLTSQSRLYDPIKKQRYTANASAPLIVPPFAIVMPGTRTIAGPEIMDLSLGVQIGIIAGYANDPQLPAALLDRLLES